MKPAHQTEPHLRISASITVICALFVGCASTPPLNMESDKGPARKSSLNNAPKLDAYTAFEIVLNGSGSQVDRKLIGDLVYQANTSAFNISIKGSTQSERLSLQPEQCRNDEKDECERRFAITGRIAAFDGYVNCYAQIRNDLNAGYTGQAIQGICRDRNSRIYQFTIYGR